MEYARNATTDTSILQPTTDALFRTCCAGQPYQVEPALPAIRDMPCRMACVWCPDQVQVPTAEPSTMVSVLSALKTIFVRMEAVYQSILCAGHSAT